MTVKETEILCFMVDNTKDEYLFLAIVDTQIPMMQMRRSSKSTPLFDMPAEQISNHTLFTYYVRMEPGKMICRCWPGHIIQYESILNNPVILHQFKLMEENYKLQFSIEDVLRKEYEYISEYQKNVLNLICSIG